MRIIGNDAKRYLNFEFTDNDYSIQYNNELPVKYTYKDGMVITNTYDERGRLRYIENGYARITLSYGTAGQVLSSSLTYL